MKSGIQDRALTFGRPRLHGNSKPVPTPILNNRNLIGAAS